MFDVSCLIFPLVLTGCWLTGLIGIGCLIRCRGKKRQYLAWSAAVFLGVLVLFFGGGVLLGFFRLTWRRIPALVLGGALLASGWVGIVLTLVCFLPMEWPGESPALRRVSKSVVAFFAAVVLFVTLWAGPLALIFGFDNEERRIEYQGQTLLEVNDGFLDPHYSYYSYHGPLVRGTERLHDGETRINGDSD